MLAALLGRSQSEADTSLNKSDRSSLDDPTNSSGVSIVAIGYQSGRHPGYGGLFIIDIL
jgi:hypothetical protein